MPKFNPIVTQLNVKSADGIKIVEQRFKGNYTREEIEKFSQKLSNDFAALGNRARHWKMQIVLKYPEWKYPGKYTPVGKPVDLWAYDRYDDEEEDPETYPEFWIYIMK